MALNFKNLFVYITIVSTILSSVLYVGVASLYHFCIAIAFIIAWNHKNSRLENICKTNEMLQFMLIWFVYSIFSLIWAPDKKLCIQYIYYILLIFLYFCVMIDHIDEREKIYKMVHFFIILSVVATTIGLWEASTGKHLLKDYIDTEGRLKLQYMPGFTYRNPNDFAMFLLQMFPFILYGMIYEKRLLFKIMSIYSVLTTFICVAACQSRTILIVILIFSLVTVLKMFQDKWGRILFAIIAIAIVLSSVPQFSPWFKDALVDLDAKNLQTSISTEGNSGLVRINLAKNGVLMCLQTVGLGVGAGCHRVVMNEYSKNFYNVGHVSVAHNFLIELLADYGIFVFIFFFLSMFYFIRKLKYLQNNLKNCNDRNLAFFLKWSVLLFPIGAISSSSMMQLTSLWGTIGFAIAFIEYHIRVEHEEVDIK